MALDIADRAFIEEVVDIKVGSYTKLVLASMPKGLIYTGMMAFGGFIAATLTLDIKNKDIEHISYPLQQAEQWLVESASRLSVWTGSFWSDYNRMWPSLTAGQRIIGLTNEQAATILSVMAQRESSNRLAKIHKFGYLGLYGMGASGLADIAWLDRTKYDRASDGVKKGFNRDEHLAFLQDPTNWVRYSYQQFMSNKALQDEAFIALANNNIERGFKWGALKRGDHKRLIGFACSAHLVGPNGALQYYSVGVDSKDRNKTNASEYAKLCENAIKGDAPKDTGSIPSGFPMDAKHYTRVSSPFGFRHIRGSRGFHGGIDFSVPTRTPVKATADGKVAFAGDYGGNCGYGVKIEHVGNYATVFCHLSRWDVSQGNWVRKGAIVGLSGGAKGAKGAGYSTGPHIHYAIKYKGNPINPKNYIPALNSSEFDVRPVDRGDAS